jgi:hypothetical protein
MVIRWMMIVHCSWIEPSASWKLSLGPYSASPLLISAIATSQGRDIIVAPVSTSIRSGWEPRVTSTATPFPLTE